MYSAVKVLLLFILLMVPAPSKAHQWTPTYPVWRPSYVEGVHVITMKLFNSRGDVDYYELQVLDTEFQPVPYASAERIMNVGHLKRKVVDIYVSSNDIERAVYICSRSKSLSDMESKTVVASRICSKSKLQ